MVNRHHPSIILARVFLTLYRYQIGATKAPEGDAGAIFQESRKTIIGNVISVRVETVVVVLNAREKW